MHRSETRQLAVCADCGAEIAPASDRGFAMASDSFLCFECAIRRGGRYDERLDRWDTEPATEDLVRAD